MISMTIVIRGKGTPKSRKIDSNIATTTRLTNRKRPRATAIDRIG